MSIVNHGPAIVLLAGLAILPRCATSGGSPSAVAAMNDADKAFVSAVNSGSADSVASLYASDAVLLPPNSPAVIGSAGIREFWAATLTAFGGAKLELTTDETDTSGDIGYERGSYRLLAPDGSVMDQGKFLQISRNRGGRWELTRDMFSSDLPPRPAAN